MFVHIKLNITVQIQFVLSNVRQQTPLMAVLIPENLSRINNWFSRLLSLNLLSADHMLLLLASYEEIFKSINALSIVANIKHCTIKRTIAILQS